MSLNVKRTAPTRPLPMVALGTALVLVTYVTPIATLPASAASLGADAAARAWILSSMSVGLAAGLLAAGVLGDAFGRRRVYAGGLAVLVVGAALCAAAWSPWVLVAARAVEGLGGAAVIACGLAVLAHSYPPGPARLHATSVWGASVGTGIAAGALLSAVLDIGSGWRETYAVTAVLGPLRGRPVCPLGRSTLRDARRALLPLRGQAHPLRGAPTPQGAGPRLTAQAWRGTCSESMAGHCAAEPRAAAGSRPAIAAIAMHARAELKTLYPIYIA